MEQGPSTEMVAALERLGQALEQWERAHPQATLAELEQAVLEQAVLEQTRAVLPVLLGGLLRRTHAPLGARQPPAGGSLSALRAAAAGAELAGAPGAHGLRGAAL